MIPFTVKPAIKQSMPWGRPVLSVATSPLHSLIIVPSIQRSEKAKMAKDNSSIFILLGFNFTVISNKNTVFFYLI